MLGILPAAISLALALNCHAADSKQQKQDQQKQPDKTAKPPTREEKQKEEWKNKIKTALQELKTMNLKPWTSTDKRDEATEAGAYKVKAKDGKIQFLEKLDTTKDWPEYAEVYRKADTGAMRQTDNGWIPMNRWDPIYWSEKDKKWILTPPAQLEFFEYRAKQELIITLIGRLSVEQEFDKCQYNISVIKNSGPSLKPEEKTKMLSEIDAASLKAAAPWGGGDILSKINRISVDFNSENDPSKLISLAAERQKLIESAAGMIMKK